MSFGTLAVYIQGVQNFLSSQRHVGCGTAVRRSASTGKKRQTIHIITPWNHAVVPAARGTREFSGHLGSGCSRRDLVVHLAWRLQMIPRFDVCGSRPPPLTGAHAFMYWGQGEASGSVYSMDRRGGGLRRAVLHGPGATLGGPGGGMPHMGEEQGERRRRPRRMDRGGSREEGVAHHSKFTRREVSLDVHEQSMSVSE